MKVVQKQKQYLKSITFPKEWRSVPTKITPHICGRIGFPLMIKLPQILHKTEKKAVRKACDWQELQRVLKDFEKIAKKEKLRKHEVLVQEHIKGIELIAGLKKDAAFGHAIMLGLGGIYVELLKDITFRICPITTTDAEQMIDELKSKKILKGVRGLPKANKKELIDTLVALSKVPLKHPEINELDINPLIVNAKGAFAVDVRVLTNKIPL
ncbi:MAG: acetate--CoA ligase family protein [Candidatus Aenigmarchaeota archaeon]|nr:acetate--CoA ligase family protein [Candidatus Aenigmarchaeota archaeon]